MSGYNAMSDMNNTEQSCRDKKEVYAHYLWHLAAIGLFDHFDGVREGKTGKLEKVFQLKTSRCKSIVDEIWRGMDIKCGEKKIDPENCDSPSYTYTCGDDNSARVAIIDVGLFHHLAFKDRIVDELDLRGFEHGAEYVDFDAQRFEEFNYTNNSLLFGKNAEINRIKALAKEAGISEDMLKQWEIQKLPLSLISDKNAAHGTACAGLIGGYYHAGLSNFSIDNSIDLESLRTRFQDFIKNDPEKMMLYAKKSDKPHGDDELIALIEAMQPLYVGVDPSSRLIPIATSFSPDPMQLIIALLYAVAKEADVILLARDIPDPFRAYRYIDKEVEARGYNYTDRSRQGTKDNPDKRNWDNLKTLLLKIADHIPIICASGNSGEDHLVYPANKAHDSSLISVGAVTYNAYRAGYACYGQGLTLVAPSGDGEVFNTHQMRLDKCAKSYKDHNYDSYAEHYENGSCPNNRNVPYSPQQVISTDVPEDKGYTGVADVNDLRSDALTYFSGTSASASIVAGVVSLLCRRHKLSISRNETPLFKKWTGIEVKKWLLDSDNATVNIKIGAEHELSPDISNEDDSENLHDKARWFGNGLISVKTILKPSDAPDSQKDDA